MGVETANADDILLADKLEGLGRILDVITEERISVLEFDAMVLEAASVAIVGIKAIAEDDEGARPSPFLALSQHVPLLLIPQQKSPSLTADPSHCVM